MSNITKVAPLEIFKHFLKALNISSPPVKTSRGWRVNKGVSKDFEYVSRNNAIVLRNATVSLDGDSYTKNTDLYIYQVKAELGDIAVYDEARNAVVTIKSTHSILRIDTVEVVRTKAKIVLPKHPDKELYVPLERSSAPKQVSLWDNTEMCQ